MHTYSIPSSQVNKLNPQRNSPPYFSKNRKIPLRIESTVLFPAVNLKPCTRTALHSSSLLMSKKTAGRFPNLPLFFKNPDLGIFCFKTKPASPDPVQSPINGTVLIYSTYNRTYKLQDL